MKTTVQQLIEAIEYRQTILPELFKTEEYTAGYELALTWIMDQCEYFALTSEKSQIVNAAASAYEEMFGVDGTKYGEEYYRETFKNKKSL